MKQMLRYTLVAMMFVVTAVGCGPQYDDQYLLNRTSPTDPAYVAFGQSLKCITGSTGMLLNMLNLGAYIAAPEENKMEVEDRHFPYQKIRSEGSQWRIFTDERTEIYNCVNGLNILEPGAVWDVLLNDNFFGRKYEELLPEGCVRVTTEDANTFGVKIEKATLYAYMRDGQSLFAALTNLNHRNPVVFDGEYRVTTNNTAFQGGEDGWLELSIEGGGEFRDATGALYGIVFEITEPYVVRVSAPGTPAQLRGGALSMTIYISPSDREYVEAQFRDNSTVTIQYTVDGLPTLSGTYVTW